MNDRLGRFGQAELTAFVALLTLYFGCFVESGDRLPGSTLLALPVALLLSELLLRRMERTGMQSLGEWLAALPRPAAALLAAGLLLSVLLPVSRSLLHFFEAMTGLIYPDARGEVLYLYLWPCVAALSLLGMETLARCGRLLLVPVLLCAAVGLLSDLPVYRIERLLPLPSPAMLPQLLPTLLQFVPVVPILLSIARGAQGLGYVRRAGRRGLLLGGAVTLLAELCLGLLYRADDLVRLSAPLYRLLLEIDTTSSAVRLDRVVLSVWTMAVLFGAAGAVYGMALLLVEALHGKDVRPFALLLSTVTLTFALLLHTLEPMRSAPIQTARWLCLMPLLLDRVPRGTGRFGLRVCGEHRLFARGHAALSHRAAMRHGRKRQGGQRFAADARAVRRGTDAV